MSNCKPISTPADVNSKLSSEAGARISNPKHYRSLAGAFQYLTFTRPRHFLCHATSLSVYAWSKRATLHDLEKDYSLHSRNALLWTANLQNQDRLLNSLLWRGLGRMPRHKEIDFRVLRLSRRQPGFLVFQTTTNCLQIQRRSRVHGCGEYCCRNVLDKVLALGTTYTNPQSHTPVKHQKTKQLSSTCTLSEKRSLLVKWKYFMSQQLSSTLIYSPRGYHLPCSTPSGPV